MRVGIIHSPRVPEDGGGFTYANDVFHGLLQNVQHAHHEFIVLTADVETCRRVTEGRNVDCVQFPPVIPRATKTLWMASEAGLSAWKKARYPFSPFGLKAAYDRRRRSYLLSQLNRYEIDMLWAIGDSPQIIDVPYIATVWDLQHRLQPFFPEVSREEEWSGRENFYATILRRATYVIVGTAAGRKEVERFYGVAADRIRILPHPTPSFALESEAADVGAALHRHGLNPGFLFYPAQFWSHKNHVSLLRALALLSDKDGLSLEAVFVGSDKGNMEHVRQLTGALGLRGKIHFLGFVPMEDLVALYRGALALTYVSYFGPENLPPLEAFALGCPVIAARVPGAEEQLGDAAILVDPADYQQLAEAVKSVYENTALRSQLVEKGRERALRFTAKDYIEGMFALLDEFDPVRRCWSGSGSYSLR